MQVYVEGRDEARPATPGTERRSRRGRGAEPAAAGEGQVLDCRGFDARAALHPAAAALHRGHAGQGAGGAGHRPPQHLRGHPRRDPEPGLRGEGRRGSSSPRSWARSWWTSWWRAFPASWIPASPRRWRPRLDEIEEGTADWLESMHEFYAAFTRWLEQAKHKMKNVKAMEEPTRPGLREVRPSHGHQVGPLREVPGLLRLPGVQEHEGAARATATAAPEAGRQRRGSRARGRPARTAGSPWC